MDSNMFDDIEMTNGPSVDPRSMTNPEEFNKMLEDMLKPRPLPVVRFSEDAEIAPTTQNCLFRARINRIEDGYAYMGWGIDSARLQGHCVLQFTKIIGNESGGIFGGCTSWSSGDQREIRVKLQTGVDLQDDILDQWIEFFYIDSTPLVFVFATDD